MEDQERVAEALADRYRIEREIGAGGMATVYLAQDLKHNRQVAVKVLDPDLAERLGAERFLREIETAANLTHPHILPLFDSGEADGFLFYVMPFVEGESLRSRLTKEKQLPVEDAVQITREIADALAFAHEKGVVHRDVKPANVMLEAGHAVLADFGVAHAVAEAKEDRLTRTGSSLGTPAYMSPEQAAGEQDLDGRSDQYALGCVLFEMLAGHPPFTGAQVEAVVRQHLTEEPPSVTQARPAVNEEVVAVIKRALAKSPADRFKTTGEMAAELALTTMPAPEGPKGIPLHERPIWQLFAGWAVASLVVFGASGSLTDVVGLPSWVPAVSGLICLASLPLVLATVLAQRRISREFKTPSVAPVTGYQGRLTWRTVGFAIGGAFVLLGAGTLGYMGMRALGIGPVSTLMAQGVLEERDVLIVSDFLDHTGDPTLALALTEAIHTDLTQSPTVRVMSPGEVTAALERMERAPQGHVTPAVAREIAVREGVKAVLAGEINAAGTGYLLSAQLVSAESNEILTAVRVTARDSTQVIDAIDELSARLRERIGESLRTIRRSPSLSRVTTASLPALRRYTRALEAEDQGDADRAMALLEEAVALDTAFAMAYRKLGVIMENRMLSRAGTIDALTRAYQHRERLTEREGYLAAAAYHRAVTGEEERAIQAFEAMLDLDPDDSWALNNLGVVYSDRREHALAAQAYARAFEVDSGNPLAINNLASTMMSLGDLAGADSAVAVAAGLFPTDPTVAEQRALLHYARGEFDRTYSVIDSIREATQSPYWRYGRAPVILLFMDALMGRTRSADRRMEEFTVAAERLGTQGLYLSFASSKAQHDVYVRGRSSEALTLLNESVDQFFDSLAPEDRFYFDLAQAYAVAGNLDRARELLAEGERLLDPWFFGQSRGDYHGARGYIAIAEGRFSDAVDEFRLMDAELGCTICPLHGMGTAYRLTNQPDSAIAAFERYVSTPRSGHVITDAVWLPSVYLHLGELYEERGDEDRAADYYNRLMDLWHDADPELQPRVERGRRALERLHREATDSVGSG
jgi:tetratricopeptide (TPR) repeat protein/tRNA A-37 threonylcarbamoyl transferase component Bud32